MLPDLPPEPPRTKVPWGHIVMGVSGWVMYLFAANTVTLVLAIALSLLALPRFIRGPWEKADERITAQLNQHQRPSPRVKHILLDTEKLLWEGADHPISLVGWYAAGILATGSAWALLVYVAWGQWFLWTVLILWILSMLWVLLKTIIQRRNRLCITNKRVFVVYGLFTTNHEMMPLSKMTNEQLQIPWHSNLLSWLRLISTQYGTIKPDSAGEEGKLGKVKFIRHAIQVNRVVMQRALG
ncbi:MAG TPA: hypothetical protein VJM46_00700 [Candidatus Saccharimonadales bacterium]|nr:hypothetical protein [Candidatus Saccharimonadales bacterium]